MRNGLFQQLRSATRADFTEYLKNNVACIYVVFAITFGFYARQHICHSAYMPRQFRLTVCHTRDVCQNGLTHHQNSFTI